MVKEDKPALMDILDRTKMFTGEELAVALELIDLWLEKPDQKDYIIYTITDREEIGGYVCYGPTPAAEGTYDLYWIAVDPALQGRGLGRRLLDFTEKKVREAEGRLVIIETSSLEKYMPTRHFYEKNGYTVEARIRDFYREGDDRLIYVKRF
jgi:ribosomal protein S18 acetylase RimI-like enzyme